MPLASFLFPISARVNESAHLEIGGCDVCDLADEHGTPLYVFDELTLREHASKTSSAFRSRWDDVAVLYATKAFFAPWLARFYREIGLGLEVTSEGELVIAGRAGFDPDTIYLHGNDKTPAEIQSALGLGIRHFVCDNLDEISLLDRLAGQSPQSESRPLQVLIRLAPNIDAHTHRYLTTGVADSKFGLGIANGMADGAARRILDSPNLELVGLHFHLGSQVFDTGAVHQACDAVLDLAADWRARFGFELCKLNIGGGWGVAYNESQRSLDVEAFAELVTSAIRKGLRARGLDPHVKLLVEPGRALVARAAVAAYRVGSVKVIPGVRAFVAVDGGMGDNIRPALYGASYEAFLANRICEPLTREYAVAGRFCEQGDVLIEKARLPETLVGDLVVIPVAGAYQLPMASNYNLIPRPAIVLVQQGRARLVRRRETIEDLVACEVEA
jgi:diaminopimelate decarboxylase